jgi:hypothetical protein
MAQKNATPNKEQQAAIKKAGLKPLMWSVKKELPSQLIIIHRITGEFKVVNKEKTAPSATNTESGKGESD